SGTCLSRRIRLFLSPISYTRNSYNSATPYAREVSIAVRQILTEIQSNILEKKPFNPDMVSGDFRIAFSDYVEATLGKSLLERLTKLAPGIHIRVSNLNRTDMLDALDGGRIDLLVDVSAHHKSWHFKQELYQEEFVCVVDKDVSFSEMTVERYLEGRHILASTQESVIALLDKTMAQPKVAQNVAWSTPHLMAIPFLVTNSDCIALLPRRLAQKYATCWN
ncbi:MAG: LysR substrate-binding domain-containing protein, partial [Cyanobacteria bacterium J06627_3]